MSAAGFSQRTSIIVALAGIGLLILTQAALSRIGNPRAEEEPAARPDPQDPSD